MVQSKSLKLYSVTIVFSVGAHNKVTNVSDWILKDQVVVEMIASAVQRNSGRGNFESFLAISEFLQNIPVLNIHVPIDCLEYSPLSSLNMP